MKAPDLQLPKRKIPSVDEFELENGLRGLFIDVADASAMSVELWFQAGHFFSPDDKPDLAHFLEHLVLGANRDYPTPAKFSEAFQRFGSRYNAHVNPSRIWYEFDAPDFDWQRSFEVLLAAISRPLFLESDFITEGQVIRQELISGADDQDHVFTQDLLIKMGFYNRPLAQRIKKLKNIDLKSIKDYHRKTHGSANARIIVAGSLSPARRRWIKQKLTDLDWPSKKATWKPGPLDKLQPTGLFHRPNPKRQGVAYDLNFTNSQRQLELVEMDTLATIIDLFHDGNESRIWGALRQKGLVYEIDFDNISTRSSGGIGFCGDTSPQNLEAIFDLILTEIDRLLAGDLKPEEIEAVNARVLGGRMLNSFTPLYWIGHYKHHWLNRDLVVPASFQSRLKAVDTQKVQALAHYLVGPKQWSLGLHGPVSDSLKRKLKTKLDNWQPAQP